MESFARQQEHSLVMLDAVAYPVWIFSIATFRILFANASAQTLLGYKKAELEGLSIIALKPEGEQKRLRRQVRDFSRTACDAGIWTIISKSGAKRRVSFFWQRVTLAGQDAVLATIGDQAAVLKTQKREAVLEKAVEAAEQAAQLTEDAFRKLFEAAPGKMLALTPNTHRIVAVTDEYAAATMADRDKIYGRNLFEVYPDNPEESEADGASQLRASLERVEALKSLDVMNVLRYPIRNTDGKFIERFWLPLNKPVFNSLGEMVYIIHRAEDVTALQAEVRTSRSGSAESSLHQMNAMLQLQELRTAMTVLQEHEARLRAARHLFKLGSWEFDVKSQHYHWSDRVFEIYGLPSSGSAPLDHDGYLSRIHPDDRPLVQEAIVRFHRENLPTLEFQHRVFRENEVVVHVKIVGERHLVGRREFVIGFVQDITDHMALERKLAESQELIRKAGNSLNIGGWRIDANMRNLVGTEGISHIFEVDHDSQPRLDDGLNLYAPTDRERIIYLMRCCVMDGVTFDEVFETRTAKGKDIRIRILGWPVHDASGRVIAAQGTLQDLTQLLEAEKQVVQADARQREMLESISDAFFALDQEWRLTYLNSQAERLLGQSREALIGENLWQAFPEAVGSEFEKNYRFAVQSGQTMRFLEFFPPLDKWFDVTAYPVVDGLTVYFQDATEDRKKTEHLRLLEAAAARMNDTLLITEVEPHADAGGPKIVYVNQAIEGMTGWKQDELIGLTPHVLQGPKTDGPELQRLRRAIAEKKSAHVELINYDREGRPYWVDISMAPVFDNSGNCTHFVAVERDVSDWKKAQDELLFAATRDDITGLLNRTSFTHVLDRKLQEIQETEKSLALILIDCDNFKSVNDTLGHSVGDILLAAIAKRLRAELNEQNTLARLGGDEFIILVPDATACDAMQLADSLRDSLLAPFQVGEERLSVTASIGLAMAPADAQTATLLIQNVDMAMYRSKQTGKNQVTRFDKTLREVAVRQAGLTQALHEALTSRTGFWLAFQPLVCAMSKKLVGAEALLRWSHPARGMISPSEFIPAAESAGLIRMLDRMVVDFAARQVAEWSVQGRGVHVSINLSALSLQIAGMSDHVIQSLVEHGTPFDLFGIEITESLQLNNSNEVRANLQAMREVGICISIDDFGTGHSSLSYLQRLPLDKVKIDQSFVARITLGDGGANPMITAILAMAKALKLSVVAEGVETQEQCNWLSTQGCDVLQGYLLGKPADAFNFMDLYLEPDSQAAGRWSDRTAAGDA